MPNKVAKRQRSWRGQVDRQRNRKGQGTEASKLVLQLTTMPALALASFHDELLLVTRPWKTSSAPRCSPGGSGLEPWWNSQRKAAAAWSPHPPWCPIRHSLFPPLHPPTSGRLSTLPPLLPLLCCYLVLSRSRCLVNCSRCHTSFHWTCCMVVGSCQRLGMCYCQPCKRNPCLLAGAQPKPQLHKSIHLDEAFLEEQLEEMPAFHVTAARLQESSCHKQDLPDVLVPAKVKKQIRNIYRVWFDLANT